jgi:hypothetical protein
MTNGPSRAILIAIVVTVVSAATTDTLAQRGREDSPPHVAPLVPGFGVDVRFDPVPGFGSETTRTVVKTARDRREAEGVMQRFDLNRDGQLDLVEVRRSPWSNDMNQIDINNDGFVSLSELSWRYARRRMERELGSSSASASGDRGPGRVATRPPAGGESSGVAAVME